MKIPRITPREVQEQLTLRETVNFLDVRNPQAWDAAKTKIPGAIRARGEDWEQRTLAELPKDRTLVAYCT